MKTLRKYGWIHSKRDDRDMHFDMVMTRKPLPDHIDLRQFFQPAYDQGQIGSCVLNAAKGYQEFLEAKDKQPLVLFSRLFPYYNVRAMEGTVNQDAGCEIRDAIKTLVSLGNCPEITWPYDEAHLYDKPSDEAYQEALNYQLQSYYRVHGLYQMQNALASGYPVLLGMEVYDSFESEEVAKTGIMPMPDLTKEQLQGGHGVLLVGYDMSECVGVVRNSWGTSWGIDGYFKMPFDYLSSHMVSDCWVITRGEGL